MIDKEMQGYIDAPLADPLRLYLPKGTRPTKRGPRHQHVDNIGAPKLTRAELAERKQDQHSAKIVTLLDYYATTSIPVERVASHTGLTVEQATEAMNRRGRTLAA